MVRYSTIVSFVLAHFVHRKITQNSFFILVKTDERNLSDMETLVWTPENTLSDREIDQFLVVARYVKIP
jgi:hypothetical protein